MNILKPEKKILVIKGLVEGNSIRSISRMTGVHKTTIASLLYRVGEGCEALTAKTLRGLNCQVIEADEIWCFVGKKKVRVTPEDKLNSPELGDQWVFVAIDAETKLVPAYEIGKRNLNVAYKFMQTLKDRIDNRIQLTTDAFTGYREAVDLTFGSDIDYAQLIKKYKPDMGGERRYSPPTVTGVTQWIVTGSPDIERVSTSYVERQNLTMRMQMRRFTRLTNAFSKTLKGLRASVALHFAHYNFCRTHSTIKCTPAMASGITGRAWRIEDLLQYESKI